VAKLIYLRTLAQTRKYFHKFIEISQFSILAAQCVFYARTAFKTTPKIISKKFSLQDASILRRF